ncbi:ABC transporter permease [Stackebrandtia nassauensis]|uniref:Inner-membrane translocator n=1 Tax=Stackebrandtia nassauensis (strain DSM 44728 / CIP 108903 / NRRL B-16338 / NBRC 102104 / LLR-40K-21) TaxID=446470 RepID=D3PUB6_STANL|nr:ABC transporter permease [Stackebrandtia nassauensis]ADD41062.1 inner-membrane translocator [Stackebrandtia nassauensis DSM 44728]
MNDKTTETTPKEDESAPEKKSGFGTTFFGYVKTANAVMVTIYSILLALLIAGILVFTTTDSDDPFGTVLSMYSGLFTSSIIDPVTVNDFFLGAVPIEDVLRSPSDTLFATAPLVLSGLAVGLAFRTGLFNIGAQGQVIMGAIGATIIGFVLNVPWFLHLPLALAAGLLAGAIYGGVPGLLKARTGAHEVITSIMLNYVASLFLVWVIGTRFMDDPDRNDAISQPVNDSAWLPFLGELFEQKSIVRVNAGIIVALLAAWFVAWLLNRSTLGFRLRSVGLNPEASRTAGMSVTRTYPTSMALAGGLAGLAGAVLALGGTTAPALSSSVIGEVGFDGITVALLGRGKPWGIVGAALLFGALRNGGSNLQTYGIPVDLAIIVQALIVLFIAAPALVKTMLRLRTPAGGLATTTAKGW